LFGVLHVVCSVAPDVGFLSTVELRQVRVLLTVFPLQILIIVALLPQPALSAVLAPVKQPLWDLDILGH